MQTGIRRGDTRGVHYWRRWSKESKPILRALTAFPNLHHALVLAIAIGLMSTTAQAGFAVNVQIKGQGTVEEENGVPLDWGDVSPGTVLEATPTSGWDFGLWVDTDNGDAHSGTTYETPGRDVNLEVVFFRIFYEPATSADDFKIAVNGPTMPRVTLNCGIEPDPSSVNTRIVFRFKFEIGEEVATNPDSFRILCYPDYESASMTRNERIDSGWRPRQEVSVKVPWWSRSS